MKRFVLWISLLFVLTLSACEELGIPDDRDITEDLTYTITFKHPDGTVIDTVTVTAGQTVIEPESPTLEGHSFAGWYSDSSLNVPYDFSQPVSGVLTLYANWEIESYTVTFHLAGEKLEETLEYDSEYPYPTPAEIPGYVFDGWYLDAEYATPVDQLTTVVADVEIYGKYVAASYTLSILDSDDNVLLTQELSYDDDLSTILATDWDDDPDTTQLVYQDEALTSTFEGTTMPSEDLTLYVGGPLTYASLPFDTTETLWIVVWNGSGTVYEDIGHMNLDPDDLYTQVEAKYYAIAKAFNEIYPNIEINLYTIPGGPNDGGRDWSQEIAQVTLMTGEHPGIWTTNDVVGDLERGLITDLSTFSEESMYQTIHPTVLQMMTIGEFVTGLPEYIIPWGIYVNRDLAESQNIDIPDVDWTIEDYTDFIANSMTNEFYGAMDTPLRIIETGVTTINQQLYSYDGTGDFVNLNSDEVRSLLPYLDEWHPNTVWGGDASVEFMDTHWWWSYKFFLENKLLTLEGDPWMMGDCANPDTDWWGRCKSNDWDIYPRPSTDYVDNTIGIVIDPLVVYNYCLEDGDIGCTPEEELQQQIAATFLLFSVTDTRSWEAKADQQFYDINNGVTGSALGDSFPITTGELFDEQMAYWYSVPNHQAYADVVSKPGFAEVVQIYKEGQYADISDKVTPYFYDQNGTRIPILNEWLSYWNPELNGGVEKGDGNFVDTLLDNLPAWNDIINARFASSYASVMNAMNTYYGIGDGGTDPGDDLTITFLIPDETVVDVDTVIDLLEGVQAIGNDEVDYIQYASVDSYNCPVVGTTITSSEPMDCEITYTIVFGGMIYSHTVSVVFEPGEIEIGALIQGWYFDSDTDLTGWGTFLTSGGTFTNEGVVDGVWTFDYTSSDVTYGTRKDYMGVPFELGKSYMISITMKSSVDGKQIQLQVGELLPTSPWFNDFLTETPPIFTLFTDYVSYDYVFTMTQDNLQGGILLELGNLPDSENIDGSLYIDSIEIFEVS